MNRLAIASIIALLTATAHAQRQPAEAVNQQDEVVNILKNVDEEAERLTIFRSGDKLEVNSYVSEVVELKNAPGFEILPHVMRAVRLEKGSARTLRYEDPNGGPTRHFIQVVTTREQLPSLLKTIEMLDLPGMVSSTGDLKYHYRLSHRRASEVAEALVNTTLSSDGGVAFDDATNTIYFEDSRSDGARNIEAIKFYDVPAPQVEFEVVAVEIEEDNGGKLGLDWDAWKGALGGQFEFTGNAFEGGDAFGRTDALLTLDASALASFLNYTVSTGTSKVSTRTVVTASNEEPAVFSSLRRIAWHGYVTTYGAPSELLEQTPGVTARGKEDPASGVGARPVAIVPPSRTQRTLQSGNPADPGASSQDPSLRTGEKAEGMYLSIRPVIGRDSVTADVRVVVNSLSGKGEKGEPIIAERLVDTRVALRDGKPFSLGGLARETEVEQRRGIPLLKDIPVLKYLFSTEATAKKLTRVYLVITPRFNNAVNYTAQSMTSSKMDVTPGSQFNEAVPAAVVPEGVPTLTE